MFLTASGKAYTYNTDGTTRADTTLSTLSFASDVTAPSANRSMYAGTATSEATITADDKMSWANVVNARSYAVRQGVRPIMEGGKEYYIMVMSSEQRRDLVLDSNYRTLVSQAAERGQKKNPLFDNAMVTIDGVVIYEHRKTLNTLGLESGSKWGVSGDVDGAQSLLLGAQAMGVALMSSQQGQWSESDRTDYGNRPGIGYGRKFGLLKPKFKPTASAASREDYGVISFKTAASAHYSA